MFIKEGVSKDASYSKYFEMKRNFPHLVSAQYYRTKAPRISTKGSTLHGMHKGLKMKILKDLSLKGFIMLDCDMSACHSRVSASLLRSECSQIKFSLEDGNFWQGQVELFQPVYRASDVKISDQEVKKILKVMLYTSLNGGNPGSAARLLDNLSKNGREYINEHNLKDPDSLAKSALYYACQEIALKFELAKEIKELNKACVVPSLQTKTFYTYTIDNVEPYISDSVHYGISRVLQGFEVVMLTVLTRLAVENNALPISLDHDGILLLLNPETDIKRLMQRLSEGFCPWSQYLLESPVPLEIKSLVVNGEVIEDGPQLKF